MKPYPFEASNHLMVPAISTRFAALSPKPESASIAGSRAEPEENSCGPPPLFGPAPPSGGPPSFLDSNPSDPMTPDPTHKFAACHCCDKARTALLSITAQDHAARISRIKR